MLVIAQPGLPSWDRIQEQRVWCEWRLIFDNGVLAEVQPVRTQSSEDLRRELRAGGALVLDEEDIVAKAHRAMRERQRRASVGQSKHLRPAGERSGRPLCI